MTDTQTTEPLTGSELDELRRLAAEGADVKLDNCELRAIVALIDRKPAKASTFGPANDDQVVDISERLAQRSPIAPEEVWQLVERIEADRVRLLDLRALVDKTRAVADVIDARVQEAIHEKAEAVQAWHVLNGINAKLQEERDALKAPTQPEPAGLSPTVAIAVMAQALWHIIDHRVGLASLAMVNGGLLREGK